MSAKLSNSFSFSWIVGKVEAEQAQETTEEKRTYYISSAMRFERYYSSIREDVSTLTDTAITLLENQDYTGFFKGCGPNYVRGIRRAQEVVALFSIVSKSTESASDFSASVQTSYYYVESDVEIVSESTFSDIEKELMIDIRGYGLGLIEDGSETLLAFTVGEFHEAMKFAWRTMTSSPNAAHIGMVYGMEVVPWINNLAFQIASNLLGEIVEVPLARSLIPLAYLIDPTSDKTWEESNRSYFKCKHHTHKIDMYGYCCESNALYNAQAKEYQTENLYMLVCRPVRQLEPAIVAENVSANGEFVARLERALRVKLNNLSLLEKCISAIRAIPERYDFRLLKHKSTSDLTVSPTVFEMKMSMDPFSDMSLVDMTNKELDEFIEMFYQPCLAAIYGMNIGNSPSTDVKYFMAYPWHSHTECKYLSCFGKGMRWDRDNGGGCVPGVMTSSPEPYTSNGSSFCKIDLDSTGDTEECKHDATALQEAQDKMATCTSNIPGSAGNVHEFLDNYCLPELTSESASAEHELDLRLVASKYCQSFSATEVKSMNVAYKKSTSQSLTSGDALSSRAVDGRTDGFFYRNSITRTTLTEQPYWSVDLGATENIDRIVVWTRTDCCHEYLDGAVISCYLEGELQVWSHTLTTALKGKNEITGISEGGDVHCDKIQIQLPGTQELSLAQVEVWNLYVEPELPTSAPTIVQVA